MTAVSAGISAALRLARGRPDGVALVGGDGASAASSFWAIAFCLPSVVCRLLMDWVGTRVPADAAHQVAREIIVFVLGWLVFVELTHRLAPVILRRHRWMRFITLWNWCNVIEGVLIVVGGIPGVLGAPPVIDQASQLVMIGWALWLEWYATRLAFDVGPVTAAVLVVLDQLIGIVLGSVALSLSP